MRRRKGGGHFLHSNNHPKAHSPLRITGSSRRSISRLCQALRTLSSNPRGCLMSHLLQYCILVIPYIALEALGVALAQCDVARGVLVVEVVE